MRQGTSSFAGQLGTTAQGVVRRSVRCVAVVALAVLPLGCVGDDAASSDGAAPGETYLALSGVELPRLAPCPEGWFEVAGTSADEVTVCLPWPDGREATCESSDQAHFVGQSACTPIGTPCPSGEWSEAISTGGPVIYVRAGAEAGGTGTMASPYGSIAEAVEARFGGPSIIALGKGTYDEAVSLPGDVTLWGACVAETVLTDRAPDPERGESTVAASGSANALRDLQITGPRAGLAVRDGAEVSLDGVLFDRTTQAAIFIEGGTVTGQRIVLRDTQPPEGDEFSIGAGVFALEGRIDWDTAVVSGMTGMAIALFDPVEADLRRVAVTNVRATPGNEGVPLAVALYGVDGPQVSLSESLLECAEFTTLSLDGPTTAFQLTDVVVRGSSGGPDCIGGAGAFVIGNGQMTFERVLVEDMTGAGLYVEGATSLTDVLIRRARARSNGEFGAAGIYLEEGPLTLERVVIEDVDGIGVFTRNTQSAVEGNDVVLRRIDAWECPPGACPESTEATVFGHGWTTIEGNAVTLNRFLLSDNAVVGLAVGPGGDANLMNGVVAHQPIGVSVQAEEFDLERLQDHVRYLDNERNLDTAELPLPDPSIFLGP